MQNLEYPGIKIGGHSVNNLRYAHDTVLFAENKEDLQQLFMLDIFMKKAERKDWNGTVKNGTEVIVIS